MTRMMMLTVLLTGCQGVFGGDGGQSGQDTITCMAIETVPLADNEASTLGFGRAEVDALIAGTHDATLAYDAGGSTPLQVTVSDLQEVRFLDQEWQDDGSGTEEMPMDEAGGDCPDVVAVDATVAVISEDGLFDEQFDVRIDAESADLAYFFHELVLPANGTFEVPDADQYDSVRAFVDASFDATGAHGEISGQGESVDGDVASATNLPVGTW